MTKVADLGYDLTFATEIQEFGVTEVRDLIADGRNVIVSAHPFPLCMINILLRSLMRTSRTTSSWYVK